MRNKLECQICKKEFKSVQSLIGHITNKKYHNMSIKNYYNLYIKSKNEDICERKNCNNKTKFHSFSKGYRRFCGYKCSNISQKREYIISKTQREQHSKFMKNLWRSDNSPYKKESIKVIKSKKK